MDPLTVLLCFSLISAPAGAGGVHVVPGGNVHLQCQSPEDAKLIQLEWRREDLLSDGFVFFYRGDGPLRNLQHPAFKDRVELRDPRMENGDVSITLYNTTINDTGTYECGVTVGDAAGSSSEIKHQIHLRVSPPPPPPGPGGGATEDEEEEEEEGLSSGFIGLLMALGISAVTLVVLAVVLLISNISRNKAAADSAELISENHNNI